MKMVENDTELIMFYNVENLFLPDENTAKKSRFSNHGLRGWNTFRYHNKLFKIAHVLDLVKQEHGKLPALIGLCEVQGEKVLKDLLENDLLHNYGFIHYESMDERGVDVALLYDKSIIDIIFSEPISYFFEIEDTQNFDTTRDVLHCEILFHNEPMHIFVLHLPSKREQDINLPKREYITQDLSIKIDKILTEKDAPVIVMGDFNANPEEVVLRNLTFNKKINKNLTNPFSALYNQQIFSTFHYKNGLLFDQMLFSEQFFNTNNTIQFKSAVVFNSDKISSRDKGFSGRPFRTYAGSRYLGGYSDHFPILSLLNIKKIN